MNPPSRRNWRQNSHRDSCEKSPQHQAEQTNAAEWMTAQREAHVNVCAWLGWVLTSEGAKRSDLQSRRAHESVMSRGKKVRQWEESRRGRRRRRRRRRSRRLLTLKLTLFISFFSKSKVHQQHQTTKKAKKDTHKHKPNKGEGEGQEEAKEEEKEGEEDFDF